MLHADKEALRTAYKLRLLAIREKELNYFLQNCINIATLAAMLAGFAQSGLIYTKCTPRAAAASALRAQASRAPCAQANEPRLRPRQTSTRIYAASARSDARSCSTRSSSSS